MEHEFIILVDDQLPDEEALMQDVLRIGWLFWTMWLLTEIAAAVAAVFFYLSLLGSVPTNLDWLPLLVYLAQGLFLVRNEMVQAVKPEGGQPWWRKVISVLSWPMHRALVQFHTKVVMADEQEPPVNTDKDWIHGTLFLSLVRWGGIWFYPFFITYMMVIFIDQSGWFSWGG